MKRFLVNNINGILGTTLFHLVVIMLLFFVKIGKIREYHKEQMLIEFTEDAELMEEMLQQMEETQDFEIPSLDRQTLHNIAQNVSQKMEEELSTDRYEKQVMEELGIESLHPEVPDDVPEEEAMLVEDQKIKDDIRPETIKNEIIKDNTAVKYDLEGRWHKYIYIPSYKCEGGGTVILEISVNQQGAVTSVNVNKTLSTNDPCLLDEAVNSAWTAKFNSSSNAPLKQSGTMTYVFLPQ